MKNFRTIFTIISAIALSGCVSNNPEKDTVTIDSLSSAVSQSETYDEGSLSEAQNGKSVVISGESANYDAVLSYTEFENTDEMFEISPSLLKIINKNTGETNIPDENLHLGTYLSDDRFIINGQPILEIIDFSDWSLAAVRVPYNNENETLHNVLLYYINNDTVQILGRNVFSLFTPADSKIEVDLEDNCFAFLDAEGNTNRYTVVYDQYETKMPYLLRSADYSAETLKTAYNTRCGEISFSYNVYEYTKNGMKISKHNFIELNSELGEKHTCEVRSPIYQGGISYDGLAEINSPIKLDVIEFSDWGAAAVRVPYYNGDKEIHSVSLYYFNDETLQLLGDGYFFPDIAVDSEITADIEKNCFSITDEDGVTKWYTAVSDPQDSQHILFKSADN